jgi:molybdopterin converting factor small subunit
MVGDRPVTTGDPASVIVAPGATVEFLPPFAGG